MQDNIKLIAKPITTIDRVERLKQTFRCRLECIKEAATLQFNLTISKKIYE